MHLVEESCIALIICICELPPVNQFDCAQMRQPHISFFEQQQMTMGSWTGRICKLFAMLNDIHESLIEDKLGEIAIDEIFFFPATVTNVELNFGHLCVWNQSKSPMQKFVQLLWSSVRAEGRSETSYLKNCHSALSPSDNAWSCKVAEISWKIISTALCHH